MYLQLLVDDENGTQCDAWVYTVHTKRYSNQNGLYLVLCLGK